MSETQKPLTVTGLIEAQDMAGWRYAPSYGAMELYVQDRPIEERQEELARLSEERLSALLSTLGNRVQDGGLRQSVFEEADRFSNILKDDSRSLSQRSLEMWGSVIGLGSLLEADREGRKSKRDPLDLLTVESRAALTTFLAVSAGLVRSFPEAKALDDDYGSFARLSITREDILEMVEHALKTAFINADSAALIQHVSEISDHTGKQADKAEQVSIVGMKNLALAAALAAPLYVGHGIAQGTLNDVGTDISDHFELGERAVTFLEMSKEKLQAFIENLAPDEAARLQDALDEARRLAKADKLRATFGKKKLPPDEDN